MPEQDVGTISTAPTQTAVNIHLKFEYMGAKDWNSLPFDTCKLYMTSFVLCVVHVLCCYVTLPFYGYHPLTPFVVFFLSLSSPPPPPPPPLPICVFYFHHFIFLLYKDYLLKVNFYYYTILPLPYSIKKPLLIQQYTIQEYE